MFKQFLFIVLLACSFNLAAFELVKQTTQGVDSIVEQGSETHPRFNFVFPDIALIDHRNRVQNTGELFNKDKNVVFAFFFTHCVSVCTVITHTLKGLQDDLPADTVIAMISIDPETDTPELLEQYVAKHQIDDRNWYMLTGDSGDIVDLQKGFEAYRGNKMNHSTSLFIKQSKSDVITEIKSEFSEIPNFFN